MDQTNLIALLNRLRKEPSETEWLEFKAGYLPAQELGEYLSALANSACFHGKSRGYLVFGIDNTTHAIVGTDFDPLQMKGKGNQDGFLWKRKKIINNKKSTFNKSKRIIFFL